MNTSLLIVFALSFALLVSSQQVFVGPKYQAEPNKQKAQELGAAISKDTTPGTFPSLELGELFLESMPVSFDTEADDMPYQFIVQRRPKLIHSVGAVAAAKWIPLGKTNYTGILQGCSNLFIRFSSATAPTNASGGFTPGIAIKCTRSGIVSANLFAMFSLEGQDSFNFFKHDLSNHPPNLSTSSSFILREIKAHFETASAWPTMIGLSAFATYDENGNIANPPRFPYRLIFHPVTAVRNSFPDAFPTQPFEDVIANKLAPGPLYYVYAQDQPQDTLDEYTLIGRIDLTSTATTSNFGDNYMFFQHTRMETDFVYYPQWVPVAKQILQQQENTPHYTYPDLPFN
jgi:hypothetical protein